MESRLLYRYKGPFVPVQSVRQNSVALGFGLVPVQQSVYRYKGVAWWRWSTVEPGIRRRRAASRSSERLLLGHCEEAGRGCVFAVLDIAPRIVAVELGDRSRWSLRNPAASRVAEAEFAARKLHSRWVTSRHECHSGVRLVLLRWCRSCQLDLLSTDQLEWIEPDSRNGAGTGVFTVPWTEPQVPAAAPSADQDQGKGVAS
uniref:Uncharacterized protein n=1 Tax=Ananas comosus var. bracteatus TaxID=296719 RepID=A0A6V7P930_ANACO|nr:unnamed protein product [Ananas comosus var. bracteatus]